MQIRQWIKEKSYHIEKYIYRKKSKKQTKKNKYKYSELFEVKQYMEKL